MGALSRGGAFAARVFARPMSSGSYQNKAASTAELPPHPETKQNDMFCFQCEQTQNGSGCTTVGVCGKTPETAALQDLLIHQLKGLSFYATRARALGVTLPAEVDLFSLESLFSTLTNVNFDSDRFVGYLNTMQKHIATSKSLYESAAKKKGIAIESPPINYSLGDNTTLEKLEAKGREVGIEGRREKLGADICGLQEMIVYGIKGMAAYADHAAVYGKRDPAIFDFIYSAMDKVGHGNLGANELLNLSLEVGKANLRVMQLLEESELALYGNPSPQKVRVTGVKGKAILVSGHDLKDVHEILKQTEGTGINVYTHGELLPAHGYPELKKYPHLVGNYGGAWQLQKMDFATFPGPIVMTTNCLIEPKKSYKARIYTRNAVGWPGVEHIQGYDFSKVVEQAKSMPGFTKDEPPRYITTGFGKNAVLNVAGPVIEAVKAGAIKHFFFIGGCDGSEGERNYFKELALGAPKDSVILTAGCGKFRFNKHEFGDINGIPRLLDMGQCNDSYGAIQVASALANAFKTDVNGLPLSFAVSWFEQKAVAVLLTLLSLNVQNIHLGPNLPGFATPLMLQILQDKFKLKTINPNIHEELKIMMGPKA